ncbi:MAG: hypothetical protein J7L03_05960 [Caldisericaceae bacterium]|nr:hypothetical protein [Caldisericaceae bacterium]
MERELNALISEVRETNKLLKGIARDINNISANLIVFVQLEHETAKKIEIIMRKMG